MQRTIGWVFVFVILVIAGYLYSQSMPHPTVEPRAPAVLITAQPIASVEKGTGVNLAASHSDFSSKLWWDDAIEVKPNAAAAPDGSNDATRLIEIAGLGRHRIETNVSGATPGEIHTLSVFVKAAERHVMVLEMRDGPVIPGAKYGRVAFNLTRKAVVNRTGDVDDAGLQELPNDWFRCWVAMPYLSDTVVFDIALLEDDNTIVYSGNPGSSLYIWGLQLEKSKRPTGYNGTSTQ